MKVSQRLFLAVLPAILGVFTVAGLAYWGEYTRQAPRSLIIVAIIAAVVSLGMAWHNTRYVARRVERLVVRATGKVSPDSATPLLRDIASAVTSGIITHSGAADELDAIESRVGDLNGAIRRAREEGERRAQQAEAQEAEYTAILDEVTRLLAARLEEAELPLHVLLASPFGSLNENQEEMLGNAQSALDAADSEVRQLRTLLALDRGTLTSVRQPVGLAELLKPALAIAQARGRSAHVAIHADVSTAAPRVMTDPLQAQAALTTLFTDAVTRMPADGEIHIVAGEGERGQIQITVTRGGASDSPSDPPLDMRLARRLIVLQQGTWTDSATGTASQTIIELPSETLVSTTIGTPRG